MSKTKGVPIDEDLLELQLVHPVYKTITKITRSSDGELIPEQTEKLVKELKVRKWFAPEQIGSVEEVVNCNNTISKTRCIIYDRYSAKFYVTWHSPGEVLSKMRSVRNPQRNKVGY